MAHVEPLAPRVASEPFCETLSRVPSGLTVVTTTNGDGRPHATTVSAFCSLSLEPPMVLVALSQSSDLLHHIRSSGRFGVNVLAEDQQEIGLACGRKGPDKLAGVAWHDDGGLPRIDATAAWVACRLRRLLPGGDHRIVVGLVTACDTGEAEALIFHRRRFHRLAR